MNKKWTISFSLPIAAMLLTALMPVLSMADSDSLSPSVGVGNENPNIIYMATDAASYDPTEAGYTYVTMTINVSDSNGVADLNGLRVEVDDTSPFATAVAKYTNTTCVTVADLSSTVRVYQCKITMAFWDAAGTYATNISIADLSGGWTKNDTTGNAPTWTYTTLVASNVSTTSITWTSVLLGVNNQASTINPLVVSNRGNAQLKVNISGADLTSGGNTLQVGNFSVDLDNNAGNGEQALTTSSALISVDSTTATVTKGVDGTPSPIEDIYFWADIPSQTIAGTYTGSWTLYEYESP
jgi:hypothetical protein